MSNVFFYVYVFLFSKCSNSYDKNINIKENKYNFSGICIVLTFVFPVLAIDQFVLLGDGMYSVCTATLSASK